MPMTTSHPSGARSWWVALGGIALAWTPMWLPPVVRAAGADPSAALRSLGLTGPAVSIAWNVLAVALLLTWVRTVERRDLASLRIVRPTGRDLEAALVLVGVAMLWSWLGTVVLPPADGPGRGSSEIVALPLLAVVAMVLSAAVFEEVLFRGYPLERLTGLTRRRWLAVALTAPFFVVPHLAFFGPGWLLHHAGGTVAIYALYLWRRNLVACMALHAAVNAPVLVPAVAARVTGA
ncbi:CPBP family intramembrane glutamic endopeptidase [Kineococcus sp. NPDC059986]|jgi:membrane protease YdiL (CAAX protease family)|uniref:CPBP family intramembrane glutamic endopeptidase n=1 Tax=Kineococcus sp. NPDC059986 TaxID=3155538 RepID=UPI00344C42B5